MSEEGQGGKQEKVMTEIWSCLIQMMLLEENGYNWFKLQLMTSFCG